jgi:hypothetical protein
MNTTMYLHKTHPTVKQAIDKKDQKRENKGKGHKGLKYNPPQTIDSIVDGQYDWLYEVFHCVNSLSLVLLEPFVRSANVRSCVATQKRHFVWA